MDISPDLKNQLDADLGLISRLNCSADARVYMCLVRLGLIPAWEITVFYDGETTAKVHTMNTALIDAGFETVVSKEHPAPECSVWDSGKMVHQDRRVDIYFSNSKEHAQRLHSIYANLEGTERTSTADAEIGKLYGFPMSAIEAYSTGETFGRKQLPEEIKHQDYVLLTPFAPSSAHWREELQIVKQWADALKQYVPQLWKAFVEEKREIERSNPHLASM